MSAPPQADPTQTSCWGRQLRQCVCRVVRGAVLWPWQTLAPAQSAPAHPEASVGHTPHKAAVRMPSTRTICNCWLAVCCNESIAQARQLQPVCQLVQTTAPLLQVVGVGSVRATERVAAAATYLLQVRNVLRVSNSHILKGGACLHMWVGHMRPWTVGVVRHAIPQHNIAIASTRSQLHELLLPRCHHPAISHQHCAHPCAALTAASQRWAQHLILPQAAVHQLLSQTAARAARCRPAGSNTDAHTRTPLQTRQLGS